MHFSVVNTSTGTQFRHKTSSNTFVCQRHEETESSLTLSLIQEGENERAGTVVLEHEYDSFLRDELCHSYDSLPHPEGAYGLRNINIEPSKRDQSLGSLMLYIGAGEVKVNGGSYLYVIQPNFHALVFYLKCGFHPDPDAARQRNTHRLSRLRSGYRPDKDYVFAERILMSRDYLTWRGHLDIVLGLLAKKLTLFFDF